MTQHPPHILVFPDAAAVADAGARLWLDAARQAIDARGVLHVALAGGSTPGALYRGAANRSDLDSTWFRTHVWWSDERAVPPDDPQSNSRMAHEALLDEVPIPDTQVHRMPGEAPDLAAAAAAYEAELRRVLGVASPGVPALDLVWLGLGADGHTASLFAASAALRVTDRLVVAVEDAPKPPLRRLTLTLPMLSAAHRVAFVVTGEEKAEAVMRALGPGAAAAADAPPAARVSGGPGAVAWLLDEAAASRLPKEQRGGGR